MIMQIDYKPVYLVITPFFPSVQSFRGPYVYDQVKAIMRDGRYRVIVMMPDFWMHKTGEYEYDGIYVYRFVQYDLPTNAWPGAGDNFSLRSFDKVLKRINVKYEDIAIVHSHVTSLAKYANYVKSKNSATKTILQHHGYDVLSITDGRFANKKWHKKRCISYGVKLCNRIDLHVGVSKEILRYLVEYDGIQLKDTYVLYNGVDITKFYSTSRLHLGFRIGCVANFWPIKDQITLIKAVEILLKEGFKDVRVTFIGTGVTREECEEYVQKQNLNNYFEFQNEVDHRQLNAFYNTLDLFVLPSYWDAFGCVYTEAYACGVPFMTAKGSGITELISESDFDKWVIAPHDYEQLAKNIQRYIEIREPLRLKCVVEINELIRHYLDYVSRWLS